MGGCEGLLYLFYYLHISKAGSIPSSMSQVAQLSSSVSSWKGKYRGENQGDFLAEVRKPLTSS